MNKRGSHVGVIISFIIFVSLIVFFYALIRTKAPSQQDYSGLISNLELKIVNNVSGNATLVSVIINENSNKNCIELEGFLGYTSGFSPTNTISSLGSYGFPISYSGNDVYAQIPSSKISGIHLLGLVNSSEFPPTGTSAMSSCQGLQYEKTGDKSYFIGGTRTYSTIFESKIKDLISRYDTKYPSLKSYFNLQNNMDFGFNFTYQNKTSISTHDEIIGSTNIYSQSFPLVYLSENGTIESGELSVRIW